jgi:hypothetical protein
MFRRLPTGLPKDPTFPANLTELGYFINDSDQIRMIEKPDEKFLYAINKNERVNEMHKEAMNSKADLTLIQDGSVDPPRRVMKDGYSSSSTDRRHSERALAFVCTG